MKIFVSHSSAQKSTVREIVSKLHPKFQLWIDEKDIDVGSVESQLIKAVDKSNLVILYLSKESLASDWVKKEMEWASERFIPILPIILPCITSDKIPKSVKVLHYISLHDYSEKSIDSVAKDINDKAVSILCEKLTLSEGGGLTEKMIEIEKNDGIKKQLKKAKHYASRLIYKIVGIQEIYSHDESVIKKLQKSEVYKATHPFTANQSAYGFETVRFKAYIDSQVQAVSRGAIIKRLYVFPNKSYVNGVGEAEKSHLFDIYRTGISSRVTYSDDISGEFADDFVIVDDKLLGLAIPKKGNMLGSEYHYFVDEESKKLIADYNSHFDRLFQFAEPLGQILNAISGKDIDHNSINMQQPAFWTKTSASFEGTTLQRLMVVLRTSGCAYDKDNAGCTMCNFKHYAVEKNKINDQILMAQLDYALEQINLESDDGNIQIDLLTLGSFLNDNEISTEFRKESFRKFAKIKKIKKVLIESRSEYISENKLLELKGLLRKDQVLEIGLGIESSDEFIRNKVLNKKLQDWQIKRVIKLCAKADVHFLPYLLVGSMNLSENEAIADAIKSAKYIADLCKKNKVKFRIAFEPVFITQDTKLEEMYLNGEYKLVNLWRVIDVIRATSNLGTIFVGLSDEELSNNRKPKGCDKCTNDLNEAIEDFNANQNIEIFNSLKCECHP